MEYIKDFLVPGDSALGRGFMQFCCSIQNEAVNVVLLSDNNLLILLLVLLT
ncbi:hypothetical protein APHNP_0226 [Anaplasma phagocytophilum str. ApNP]|uniref:Uncharacterized protein n=2 Tax=Anaplasma phagocytophilum TaxID=948 RepID=A0A0F3NIQ7_ANAPH|nr:hypothetical protein [Anaplasma phagocytophilum]KJV65141.1 hypothetical protein APHMUC_0452 [Anaplasma phagocytophilum str. ApMUC09]KJV67915.1 hypothetical protein APHNP_0226 [Anaplasma phagocytophilum str. ApNP]